MVDIEIEDGIETETMTQRGQCTSGEDRLETTFGQILVPSIKQETKPLNKINDFVPYFMLSINICPNLRLRFPPGSSLVIILTNRDKGIFSNFLATDVNPYTRRSL